MKISYSDFEKVEILSGIVVKAEAFPRARKPAYKVFVDFGEKVGTLQTSAQITAHYTPESLIGKTVLGCINLGEKNIAGFVSQFLLLGFPDEEGNICLASASPTPPKGAKLQ